MDPPWLVGLILGFILIVNGITDSFSAMDKLNNFIDIPSVVITVGGTIAALIASYPFSMLAQIPKHIMIIMFRGGKYNIPKLVDQLVDLAMVARQNGLLALEEKAEELKDPFHLPIPPKQNHQKPGKRTGYNDCPSRYGGRIL